MNLIRALFSLSVLAVAVASKADTTYTDLSQELVHDTDAITTSPGSAAVNETAAKDPFIRSAIVLEKGKVVAKYIRDDVDENEPHHVWSVTKSWTSLLIGMLIESGDLSLNETLKDIFDKRSTRKAFNNTNAFTDVSDDTTKFRENVTVEELLTMTSGLISPPEEDAANLAATMTTDAIWDMALASGTIGGSNLTDSLARPDIGTKGTFSYLATSNILSYVIELRSDLTPREYLAANVMPFLNISEEDYDWLQNADGRENAYHGIELTPLQMARFGQLYLQGGQYKEGEPLVSQSWIDATLTTHAVDPLFQAGYGYLFWNFGVFCAIGLYGQDICIDESNERVIVQQRDPDYSNPLLGSMVITPVAMDASLSFDGVSPGTVVGAPTASPSKGISDVTGPTDAPVSAAPYFTKDRVLVLGLPLVVLMW